MGAGARIEGRVEGREREREPRNYEVMVKRGGIGDR